MSGLLLDIRFAARLIYLRPTVSAVIVITLALGIAANTAMFIGFDAWALRPLPFSDPEQLVALVESHPSTGKYEYSVSPANLRDWQEEQRVFDGEIGAYFTLTFNFHNQDEPERVLGATISANLFPLLGIEPELGRVFLASEARPGGPAVAIIGHTLWKQRFDADPEVVGKTFQLDGKVHEVVGVMPARFKYPRFAEVWTPLTLDPDLVPRDQRMLRTVARLSPGTTIADARGQLAAIGERLAQTYPESNEGWRADILTLREEFVPSTIRVALAASMVAAFLVLLIICANVANLMLAQATARFQETAVRSALGASRWRLVRQLLTESLLLALLAGSLGILLGQQALSWMMTWVPIEPPYMFTMENDGRAMVFTLLISLIAGMVCGLAPIMRSTGRNIFSSLKAGGQRSSETRSGVRLRSMLVVAELGMSVMLAVCALLLVKSYLNRQVVEPGYRIENVITMRLSLTGESFQDPAQRTVFFEQALAAIEQQPEVVAVGVANHLPESRSGYQRVRLEVAGRPAARGEEVETTYYAITDGYLEALEIPLLQGRQFNSNELHEGGDVVLISESLASALWPDDSAVGRQLRLLGNQEWLTVVGIVGTIDPGHRVVGSENRPRSQLYVPYPEALSPHVALAVHTNSHDPFLLAAGIRRQLAEIDASVSASSILTMTQAIHEVQWVARYFSKLFSLYAVIALAVAVLGVYGVTAESIARRSREMGIRLALGAAPITLVRMVLKQGLTLGGSGVALGIVAALPVTGLMSAMLFAVNVHDPLVFAGVGLLLTAAACLACYIPARRAARINPIETLRFE
jgi:putative ABC transport system permease protein